MRVKHLPWVLATLLLCAAPAVPAAPARNLTAREVMQQAEASMLVSGTVVVAPDGTVASYQLDHPGDIPDAVNKLIQQAVPAWRFEPVVRDGKAILAKTDMDLRVVLHSIDDKHYRLYVASAFFGSGNALSTKSGVKNRQPRFPYEAIRQLVSGTVYLALKVDAQGHVLDAAAAQVDLRAARDEQEMEHFRKLFADATVKVAKEWTIDPTRLGTASGEQVVMVPVDFGLVGAPGGRGAAPKRPGSWDLYVPGPRQAIPWLDVRQAFSGGADALPAEGLFVLDQSAPRLKSKLGGA